HFLHLLLHLSISQRIMGDGREGEKIRIDGSLLGRLLLPLVLLLHLCLDLLHISDSVFLLIFLHLILIRHLQVGVFGDAIRTIVLVDLPSLCPGELQAIAVVPFIARIALDHEAIALGLSE
ncbi:hypothetical protein PENTCL1PPCAC_13632, partial [Pristionchus entomophagus]